MDVGNAYPLVPSSPPPDHTNVLVPLAEIAPDLVIAGAKVSEAAARLGPEAAEATPLD